MYDHVLLLAHGSPAAAPEVKPFLESLIQAKELQPERMAERTEHFQKIGNATPFGKSLQALADKLGKALAAFGVLAPVYAAVRHGGPSLKDAMVKIKKGKHSRGLAFILAPFKCDWTYEQYQQAVDQAKQAAGLSVIYDYLKIRHNHPLFTQALADKVRYTMRSLTLEQREFVHIVFVAPSIPRAISQLSDYEKEFAGACSLVIKDVAQPKWSLCYHSKDTASKEPWVEPDFSHILSQLNKEKERHVLLAPLGLVSERIESLYDLDIDARKKADTAGYGFMRAPTVIDHPKFLLMILDLMLEKMK